MGREPPDPAGLAREAYRGVFRFQIALAVVLFLATPVALASPWAFAPAVPLCGALVARLLDEEGALLEELPGYRDYCRRVRFRLLPGVW